MKSSVKNVNENDKHLKNTEELNGWKIEAITTKVEKI